MSSLITRMARGTGLSSTYIQVLARTASHRYKLYGIPKKTGGQRQIAHPARELKLLQRWLVRHEISALPVHDSVYSYVSGRSIRDIAAVHASQNYMLRLDFRDFFPSILRSDVIAVFQNAPSDEGDGRRRLTTRDLNVLADVVCYKGRLAIGAPSSPALSNAIMFAFDTSWSKIAKESGATYTRYADDVYLSTKMPNVLADLLSAIQKDLAESNPRLFINEKKTVFTSRKHRRRVTGLILTPDGQISIGRENKRMVKALVHRYHHGQLSNEEVSYLRGYVSFVVSVEPSFIGSLEKKYGTQVMRRLRNAPAGGEMQNDS